VHPDVINDIRIFIQCLCYSDMHSYHTATIYNYIKVKVKQSRYRPGVVQRFQEVKVPRIHDNGTGWW